MNAILRGAFALWCLWGVFLFTSGVGHAQQVDMGGAQCGPRAKVLKVLNDKYHETKKAMGLVNPQLMMETYTSEKGTWTFVLTNEVGVSCVLAAGENYEFEPFETPKAPGEDM